MSLVETHALYAGNISTNDITVYENVDIGNNLYVRNGLNVGNGGILANGPLSLTASFSFNTASVSRQSLLEVTHDKGYLAGDVFRLETAANTTQEFFTGNFLRFTRGGTAISNTTFLVEANGHVLASGAAQFASLTSPPSVSYSRFGTAIASLPESNWISTADDLLLSNDLYVVGSISANIASASLYKGLAFNSVGDCNDETDVLGWDLGVFSCTADDTSASSFSGIEIFNSGDPPALRYGSISYDASDFTVTFSDTASTAFIKLDYANGPASRSINQDITAIWDFQSGASFSNDVEFYDRSNNSMFAIFSSTSLGRFGLGDTTPEAFFEIASSSGITASISNIFSINADSSLLSITGKASISNSLEITRNGTTGSHLKLTDSSISPEQLNYFTLSINDGDFQIRHASKSNAYFSEELTSFSISSKSLATTIGTPASPSLVGTYNTADSANDVYVSGKYAYIADDNNSGGLAIIDISNPASPSLESILDTNDATGVYVSGRHAYIADGTNGLAIIDISNPASPILVSNLSTTTAEDVYVSGRYAYVADAADGLAIIDI